jgi:hypothetical protein
MKIKKIYNAVDANSDAMYVVVSRRVDVRCRLSSGFLLRLLSFINEEAFLQTLSVSKQACTNNYLCKKIL